MDYDDDKMIPVFGFGGFTKKMGTSHCFPVNGNENDPEVHGIDGILETYKKSLELI